MPQEVLWSAKIIFPTSVRKDTDIPASLKISDDASGIVILTYTLFVNPWLGPGMEREKSKTIGV